MMEHNDVAIRTEGRALYVKWEKSLSLHHRAECQRYVISRDHMVRLRREHATQPASVNSLDIEPTPPSEPAPVLADIAITEKKKEKPDPNFPGKDRLTAILVAIESAGAPQTLEDLLRRWKLTSPGKYPQNLAAMVKAGILISTGQGYWPAHKPQKS